MIHHERYDIPRRRISKIIITPLLRLVAALLLIFKCGLPASYAYNMRQTISGNGLSNSAILSMGLDDKGFLWIGTCDGVNIADGTVIRPFSSLYPDSSLSGNIIEDILRGSDGEMWVLSNYGLDRVSTRSHSISHYPQFHGQELLCPDLEGRRMAVLGEDSHLYLADSHSGKQDFRDLGRIHQDYSDVRCLAWRDGALWIVAADGIHVYDVPASGKETKTISPKKKFDVGSIRFAKTQDSDLFIISSDGQLSSIGKDGTRHPITDISHMIANRGRISDLVRDHQDNFFISFMTEGVMWVGLNEQKEFMALDLGLQVGVFCLERSEGQDVVWIGSDCQGVYTFWDDPYSIRSFDFNAMGNKISHPVRAIYLDAQNTLWIGTKGDGLLRIPNVDQGTPGKTIDKGTLYTQANSSLNNNSVYGFCPGSRSMLWIATDGGVNCYNHASGSLQNVKTDKPIRNIHGIYEENDTTIWMTTLGMGVARATIGGSPSSPELRNVKFYTVGDGSKALNQFFSLSVSDSGRLLFCNRGSGVYEIKDDRLVPLPMKNDFGTNAVNDVFVAVDTEEALWLGTGYGLVEVSSRGERLFQGIEDGFVNNTIHDIIRVDTGILWISTNSGLVRFDPTAGKGITYGRNYGLNVTEYSDGAAFYNGNGIIFGGINGLTFIQRHLTYTPPAPYKAALSFVRLSVSGQDMPIYDYIKEDKGVYRLELAPDENYFALTVSAPDFIDALNYSYSYSLDGMNWIDNGAETTISFTKMDYGNYTLSVRYINKVTGIESEPCVLKIKVRAPWYLSGFMKVVYLLLIFGAIGAGVWMYLRRQKERQEEEMKRLEQSHKEEVYEEKLKFFTNITHEFCTPLTLIYGPCERISSYPGSDDYIKKYIGLVRTNAERLNTLIQELIDFRRMETGHKQLKVTEVGISELCSDIVTSFSELADRNNVTLINEIEPSIMWPTDFGCLRKIMTNLISNAFKYTPSGGTIRINVRQEGGKLRLSVYNTGNGIGEDDRRRIFNRYSVLDNVEENAVKGLSARNGLGLAICHSMVDMLKGRIEIESEVGKYADFIVTIPKLPLSEECQAPQTHVVSTTVLPAAASGDAVEDEEAVGYEVSKPSSGGDRNRILVVDDNRGILTLLKDSLSEFDVETVDSADVAVESIRRLPPDLIISDIMMPGTDGVTFTRMIRQNKHTMHIPLVLLSAKNSTQEKVEGIESGADAYIGKPFSTDYLIAVVKRLLDNRKHLREYYSTSASAYEYTEGQLLHKEDKDFLEQLAAYIEENIDDEDLGPEKLATHMKISVRNLYRKFKELDQLSPNDFIKHQRISYAAKLLLTTSATVQEILYRSGFTNRSHFYKEFDKRFGMTPKAYRDANVRKDTSLDGNVSGKTGVEKV